MHKLTVLTILIFTLASHASQRLGYITFGPMIHWNFSANEFKLFSYGLESAYWNYAKDPDEGSMFFHNFPNVKKPGYGMAFGIENDRKAMRLYAEPQVGVAFAGLSAGPVLEIPWENEPARFGVQGSGWVNAIAGIEFRYQRLGGENNQSLGLYGKLATVVSGASTTY